MDAITEIKQKIDIVDLIGSYVSLKKSGRNYKGVCPFHSEKTPSFMVSQELQIYKCFGCNNAGDIFKFIQEIEGISFVDALHKLGEKAGVVVDDRAMDPQDQLKKKIYLINSTVAKFYHYILVKRNEGKEALKYVKEKRRLTDKTITDFSIGYAPDSWDTLYKFMTGKGFNVEDLLASGVIIKKSDGRGYLDKFKGRVMFPFTGIDGKVIGFNGRTIFDRDPKYLNTSETPVFQKSHFLYALDKAKVAIKKEGAIIVESQMDTIAAHQAGICNVVASSGTALTESHLRLLARYTSSLTFCFNSDGAGINATVRAIDLAEKFNFDVKVSLIPAPYKDLDEFIVAKPTKEVIEALTTQAIPIYDFLLGVAIKNNNPATAAGKKNIVAEFLKVISKIKNQVVADHYLKKLAETADMSEEKLAGMLKDYLASPSGEGFKVKFNAETPQNQGSHQPDSPPKPDIFYESHEFFFISLLLKAKFDTVTDLLYKLQVTDFVDTRAQTIFSAVKNAVDAGKALDINEISAKLNDADRSLFAEMILSPQKDDPDEAHVDRELVSSFKRLRAESVKRQLTSLTKDLKMAELAGDTKKVHELAQTVDRLKTELI